MIDSAHPLHYRNREAFDLSHLYGVGFDYGRRLADHDYAFGITGHTEKILWNDLQRFTLATFRAWTLGALRGYR